MVTIARSFDAAEICAIRSAAYGKPVAPHAIAEAVQNLSIYCLISDFGYLLCVPGKEPGDFTIALCIAPAGSGAWGKAFVEAAFDWMFANSPALRLLGVSKGQAAESIRLTYQPKGGRMKRLKSSRDTSILWIYEKSSWQPRGA